MKKLLIIAAMCLLVFSACNTEQNETQLPGETPEMTSSGITNGEALVISDAWVRPAGKNTNTGLFLNITNNTDTPDTLTGAKSDIAEKTEVHETFTKNGDMMGMREVEYLVIEPHETFTFKPMDHHIMLIKLNEDAAMGDTVNVTLLFKHSGDVPVSAIVKEQMPKMNM